MITSQIDWNSYAVSESVFLFAINSEQDLSDYVLHLRQLGAFIIPQGLYFSLEFPGNGYIGCLGLFLKLCLGEVPRIGHSVLGASLALSLLYTNNKSVNRIMATRLVFLELECARVSPGDLVKMQLLIPGFGVEPEMLHF